LLRKFEDLSLAQKTQVADVFMSHLNEKDVMVWMKDPLLQEVVEKHRWSGSIHQEFCSDSRCRSFLLFPVEANVGINKTNCCVDRVANLDIQFHDDETATSQLKFQYENHNPVTPAPPKYYGGGYRNYLRLFTNPDSLLTKFQIGGKILSKKEVDFAYLQDIQAQSYGHVVDIGGGEKAEIIAEFSHAKKLDYRTPQSFIVTLLKQSGLQTNEYYIHIVSPESTKIVLTQKTGFVVTSVRKKRVESSRNVGF
jgi:hypothetical protein